MTFEDGIQRDSYRSAERSEDRVFAQPVGSGLVVAVADGAGGSPGGAGAAEYVIQRLERALAEPHFDAFQLRGWVAFLRSLDQELDGRRLGGETTLVVVAINQSGACFGASAGDSSAAIVDHGDLLHLAGPTRHAYRARIGSGRAHPAGFGLAHLGGPLLVASDGLFHYATHQAIAEAIARYPEDLSRATAAVVNTARLPSGELQDDVALVLVRPH
ncbi:MAG: protein phosphatase 2C domain-containing protein [Polyangiaceae bacterium]